MRAQYKISKIESKSNKKKELSNARADDNFRKILASDGLTWIKYCFPTITRPGTGHEKARTSCNVKELFGEKPQKETNKQTNKNNPAKTTLYLEYQKTITEITQATSICLL